jgi:hypothetical protein
MVYIDNIKLAPATRNGPVSINVDYFHDCDNWTALSWPWMSGGQLTANPVSPGQFGNYGCGYRLVYTTTLAQSGYVWAELKGLDLTGYDYVQFHIKGKTGGEVMNVYLRERTAIGEPKREHFEPIVTTNTWQPVWIPLSRFASKVNLTDLAELKFAFEGHIETSEVFLDNISFFKLRETTLPMILKLYPLTELYVLNKNTGGDLTFYVRNLTTKANIIPPCIVPNGDKVYCGSFPAGSYEIQAFTACGGTEPNPIAIRAYNGGPQTTEVFCK